MHANSDKDDLSDGEQDYSMPSKKIKFGDEELQTKDYQSMGIPCSHEV